MLKLDQKDRIILYELDRNARQPLSAIAKKAGLCREAVLYRLKGYFKGGVLHNYLTVVNMAKFGFSHHKIFVKLQNLTEKQEAEVISYLCRHQSISWVASCDGKYSLAFGVKARTLSELNSVLKELNGRYWQYFMGQDIASIVEAHHFYRDYLIGTSGTTEREIRWTSDDVMAKMDWKDFEILDRLCENSRASSVEIAKSAGISPDAVSKRIKQMEKTGVISHYAIWPDANKLAGAYYKVLISLRNLDAEKEKRLLAFCREHPNIVYVVSTVGSWQFEMDVEIETPARFRELMRNFLKRFSDIVSDYAALDVYDEHKFRFFEKGLIKNRDNE